MQTWWWLHNNTNGFLFDIGASMEVTFGPQLVESADSAYQRFSLWLGLNLLWIRKDAKKVEGFHYSKGTHYKKNCFVVIIFCYGDKVMLLVMFVQRLLWTIGLVLVAQGWRKSRVCLLSEVEKCDLLVEFICSYYILSNKCFIWITGCLEVSFDVVSRQLVVVWDELSRSGLS